MYDIYNGPSLTVSLARTLSTLQVSASSVQHSGEAWLSPLWGKRHDGMKANHLIIIYSGRGNLNLDCNIDYKGAAVLGLLHDTLCVIQNG